MQRFFRLQKSGISFDEMREYNSVHAGEDGEERPGGLAACDRIEVSPNFGGAWGAFDDGEVVVFDGYTIEKIYDGALTEPIKEIARFSTKEWTSMIESGKVWEYDG